MAKWRLVDVLAGYNETSSLHVFLGSSLNKQLLPTINSLGKIINEKSVVAFFYIFVLYLTNRDYNYLYVHIFMYILFCIYHIKLPYIPSHFLSRLTHLTLFSFFLFHFPFCLSSIRFFVYSDLYSPYPVVRGVSSICTLCP